MVVLGASTSFGAWAAWGNVVVLGLVGGLVTLVSLLPLAMANDDPGCGPLLRSGIGQLITLAGLVASVVGGVWVAEVATASVGWTAVGWGVGGWVTWTGGYVHLGRAPVRDGATRRPEVLKTPSENPAVN